MAEADLRTNVITLLSTTTISDMTVDTAHTLYTVPTGYSLMLDHCKMVATATGISAFRFTIGRSTALTDFSIGITASTGIVVPTNLAAVNDFINLRPTILTAATPPKQKAYAAGAIIQLDVTTVNASASGCIIYLYGILF